MDTYRDDYAALREQVEALKGELEDAKRSLEEERALASTHKRAAHAFETELMRVRPAASKGRSAAALATAAFVGLAVGVLVESGVANGRLKAQEQTAAQRLSACTDDLFSCRTRR